MDAFGKNTQPIKRQTLDSICESAHCPVLVTKSRDRFTPSAQPFFANRRFGVFLENINYLQKLVTSTSRHGYFTGPTGSGKTSTPYTSLQEIATKYVNVIIVEDPVEYVLPRITRTWLLSRTRSRKAFYK